MSDNNSPWGPKPGSGNGGGKGDGNSPWGGGQRPNRPQRPSRDNVIEGFKSRTGGGGNGGGNNGQLPEFNIPKWAFLLVPAFFLVSTSFFTVQGNEQALILRFGDYQRTVGSGLHFKFPNPIEKKTVQDVTNQRETIVGINNNAESLMLTGDENIVDINFAVLWNIKDLKSYVLKVDQPEDLVKSAAESVVREIIGKNELDSIITTGRQQYGGQVRERLQELLDEYESGVNVEGVQFQKTDPPAEVVDDFLDVVNASQEAERAINEARAYRNTKVLEAEGEAAKLLQQAEGYRDSVIADAEGEAQRFKLIYGEYKLAPKVTRQRMYLETLEKVYGDAEKIVLDGDAGSGVVPYLPLDQLNKKGN
jgi:membrane protease subunit HflK